MHNRRLFDIIEKMKNKTAYFNDRIKISKKKDKSFLGGYRTKYKSNFIAVNILGKKVAPNGIYYLIALPPNHIIRKEVHESELYLK